MEFGVRWGQNLSLFEKFRGIYEAFNMGRKIVGFDTFEGFPSTSQKDGNSELAVGGAFSVTPGYEAYLSRLMKVHEKEGLQTAFPRHELRKGDAAAEIKDYLEKHPETIISLAYFDMDIYEPTKKCLEAIQTYVTKGSIIAFDELNYEPFPGETIALREVIGLDRYKLVHTRYSSARAYFVVD
jgi:hypothetical protein